MLVTDGSAATNNVFKDYAADYDNEFGKVVKPAPGRPRQYNCNASPPRAHYDWYMNIIMLQSLN
jgi:hypothetical protein